MQVWRNELKYYINYADYIVLSNLLDKGLKRDPNNFKNNGYIRSLYFDNIFNDAFYEKLAGIEKRKKIRIRIYDFKGDLIKFEIKNKFNNNIFKETALIKKKNIKEIQNTNYDVLLKYNNKTLNKIYNIFKQNHFRPVVLIDYFREGYTYDLNHIRITFDKDLKSSTNCSDIFDKDVYMIPLLKKGHMIMEIKYNRFLPQWVKRLLQINRFERCAISKYCIGRINKFKN